MRYVPIQSIVENAILKNTIYGPNGNILLKEGVVLDSYYLSKLKEVGINGVYIEDELSKGIEIKNIISEELRHEAVRSVQETFIYAQKSHASDKEFEKNNDIINKVTKKIVDEILSSEELMINMIDLKVFDDYTFYHSLNVAIISIVLGVSLNFTKEELYALGLGAILHDIGKIFVPKEILNKPAKLDDKEWSRIRNHPTIGFKFLKDKFKLPADAYKGIQMHHERWNGSGYPKKHSHNDISKYGRIIAVADVYDALISDRPYRKSLLPSEAVEYILAGNDTLFDPKIVEIFLRKVTPYPSGTIVKLSNNSLAIVVENFEGNGNRPLVRVFKKNGKNIDPYILDLRKHENLSITITGVKKD
ncbi:MAG: HD-GYP domain-containing protein [Bacillota bacterium]|nr:HD-GYP domain-containing protein [Bacillota bacterium]